MKKYILLCFVLLLSSCDPSYGLTYKISLENLHEEQIEEIKSIQYVIEERSKSLKHTYVSCSKKNNQFKFFFYTTGISKKNEEIIRLTNLLEKRLNIQNITFKTSEKIKKGNIFK